MRRILTDEGKLVIYSQRIVRDTAFTSKRGNHAVLSYLRKVKGNLVTIL